MSRTDSFDQSQMNDDYTIDQGWENYTEVEHATWKKLYERQRKMLQNRACPEILRGMEELEMTPDQIPDFRKLSEILVKKTGWQVVAVPGLVPDEVFYDHLRNRRFPAGNFIRTPEQIDYIEEPDVFHDVFGHVPMLTDPHFADYVVEYGKGGLKAMEHGCVPNLAHLYWYTVEFGLIKRPDDDLKIYGAGIISSYGESKFSLESDSPHRVWFDLERCLSTEHIIDDYQQTYFVIDSFEKLMDLTVNTDFAPIYERIKDKDELDPAKVYDGDKLYNEGTCTYHAEKKLKTHSTQ